MYSIVALKRHLRKHHAEGGLPPVNHEVEVVPANAPVAVQIEEQILDDNHGDFGIHDDDDANSRFSLDHFVSDLYSNIQLYVAQLYSIPNVNRQLVDDIVNATSDLISRSVSNLKDNVFHFVSSFEDVPPDYADEVSKLENMFSTLQNPFEFMDSEHKRFRSLSQSGHFIAPERFEMGHVDSYKKSADGIMELIQKPVYGQMVPLRHVFKSFLEIPGMLTVIRDYLNSLDDSKVANFVQGDLWKELSSSFDNEGKFVLPLHLEFDDYEPDNALGSHHTDHSLGALYATIPCLPPQIQSCLDNIFLFTTFESKFRKLLGNRMAFLCSIKEIEFLEKDGISVNYGDGRIQVYFCCALIIADNLGFNSILGFVEGFRGNFYCTICKLHRTVMEHHCRPVPIPRMRTEVNYAEDLVVGDCSLTGINEECVWNEMPSFHCVKNVHCDAMHDICEGMLKYDLCQILFNLIGVRGYFSIELFIDRLQGFDYGPNEVGNKPPTCNLSLNCLEKCSWNLSSSEMLCLSRNLGEIVGDLVPDTNRVWKLYVLVREIVEILTAPHFKKGLDVYLQTLIQEHHEMYIVFFGSLKPKHHLMLHYPEILRRNGPLFSISSLMCERNHRRGKIYAKVCNSRVNFALSVAVKSQLALCERLMRSDSFTNRLKTYGVSNVRIDSIANYNSVVASLPLHRPGDIVSLAKSVQIYGTLYCINSILVVKVGDLLPTFGKIVNIIVKDCKTVIFVTRVLCTLSYINHICAFEVVPANEYLALCQENLVSYVPLWERRFFCKSVVSLKHSL